MYFKNVIRLFKDNEIMVFLTNKKEEVLEAKTVEEFKKDTLFSHFKVVKIEPLDAFTVEIQVEK